MNESTAGSPVLAVLRTCLTQLDEASWKALIDAVAPALTKVARNVLIEWGRPGDSEDLKDILQEIFLKLTADSAALLRRLPLDSEQAALGYLRVAAANCARDYLKAQHAQKRDRGRTSTIEESTANLATALDAHDIERVILLQQVEAALPAEEPVRTWFWLHYRQGFSVREIAQLAGVELSEKGVESVIRRTTLALREALTRDTTPVAKESAGGNSL